MGVGLGVAGLVLGAIGSGVSAVSQYQQASYNAKVSANQKKAIAQARDVNRQLDQEQFEQFRARFLALNGASGFSLSGSPMASLIASTNRFKKDQAIKDYEARLGIQTAESQRRLFQMEGPAALTSGLTSAVGSGITNYYLLNN